MTTPKQSWEEEFNTLVEEYASQSYLYSEENGSKKDKLLALENLKSFVSQIESSAYERGRYEIWKQFLNIDSDERILDDKSVANMVKESIRQETAREIIEMIPEVCREECVYNGLKQKLKDKYGIK